MGTPLLHYNYTILATTTVVYSNICYPDFILEEHLKNGNIGQKTENKLKRKESLPRDKLLFFLVKKFPLEFPSPPFYTTFPCPSRGEYVDI